MNGLLYGTTVVETGGSVSDANGCCMQKMTGESSENKTADLASAIKYQRLRKGLSARALSEKAHLSPSYVSKVESNEIEPSLKAFAKIADALKLNLYEVQYLLTVVREES